MVAVAAIALAVVVGLRHATTGPRSFPAPRQSALAGLTVRQRIVAIAESQVGYATDPTGTYCNKFSDFWNAGSPGCPSGELSEEWCADFAAWAWRLAGAPFSYGYGSGEVNAGAASFYDWGTAHGEWHWASSGYAPQPGDVAVYGLRLGANPTAAHVALVSRVTPGERGPDVINGDGNRTGFSVVEVVSDQQRIRTPQGVFGLAGYASPPPA